MRISFQKAALEASALAEAFPDLWRFASDDETAIAYSPAFREFSIPVLDGSWTPRTGRSGIVITHDPWSGPALPSSLRDRWFDELKALGHDDPWNVASIPEAFRGEQWWVERAL